MRTNRFFNVIYAFVVRALPPDERDQYLAELDDPLDPNAPPSEATLEQEGENFMALMQMTGGGSGTQG